MLRAARRRARGVRTARGSGVPVQAGPPKTCGRRSGGERAGGGPLPSSTRLERLSSCHGRAGCSALPPPRVTNDVCGLPLNCAHIIAVCAWVCGAVMTRADWGSAIHSSFPRGSTGGPLAACVVTTVYARRHRVRRAAGRPRPCPVRPTPRRSPPPCMRGTVALLTRIQIRKLTRRVCKLVRLNIE